MFTPILALTAIAWDQAALIGIITAILAVTLTLAEVVKYVIKHYVFRSDGKEKLGKEEERGIGSILTAAEREALFSTKESVRKMSDIHDVKDAEGVPLVYHQRETAKQIVESQRELFSIMNKILVIMESHVRSHDRQLTLQEDQNRAIASLAMAVEGLRKVADEQANSIQRIKEKVKVGSTTD